jgi:ABC-type protease/lipase transport system fused ATPase/permease subunit
MMAAPDPESFGIVEKLIGAVLAIGTPVIAAHTWVNKRLDKKADKHAVNNEFQEVRAELAYQREAQAKMADQMRQNEQRAQDRHERLMERLTGENR